MARVYQNDYQASRRRKLHTSISLDPLSTIRVSPDMTPTNDGNDNDDDAVATTSNRPIPAFYGVYLLRSAIRSASLYIGSTPDPARRLAQHNGHKRGGAHRTARESLRPWAMVVVVSGFMNRVGALQFEYVFPRKRVDDAGIGAAGRLLRGAGGHGSTRSCRDMSVTMRKLATARTNRSSLGDR